MITLCVGGALLAASQAEALRDAMARAERSLTGHAACFESAAVRGAARAS